MDKHTIQRVLGLFSFTVGLLLGLVLITASVWADLEAHNYGFQRFYAEGLSTLHCPVLMERNETGRMYVTLENKADIKVGRAVMVRLSGAMLDYEERYRLEMEPGQKSQVPWTIDKQNLELGRFIFAHVMTYPAYEAPMREAMCGVFVVSAPGLTGPQIYYGLLALAVLGLGLGLWLWDTSRAPELGTYKQIRLAMRFLVAAILLGLVVTALGNWMVGIVILMVVVLTMTSIMYLVTTA